MLQPSPPLGGNVHVRENETAALKVSQNILHAPDGMAIGMIRKLEALRKLPSFH